MRIGFPVSKKLLQIIIILNIFFPKLTFANGPITLRVADYFPSSHIIYDSIKFWMAESERLSGGAVKFQHFISEQLGKAKDQLALVQSGVADISLVVPAYVSDKLPLSVAAELPGMSSSGSTCPGSIAYTKLSQNGIFAKQEYEPAGVRMLWGLSYPPYQLMMNKNSFHSLNDINGAKIRVLGASMELLVRDLKGVPIKMATPDMFEALSRNTIDGFLYTHGGVFNLKLTGLVKSATANGNFGGGVGGYIISERRWKELPTVVQNAMRDASEKTVRHFCARADKEAAESAEKLRQGGVKLVTFSPSDQKELEKLYADVANDWVANLKKRGKPGDEAINQFRKALIDAQ